MTSAPDPHAVEYLARTDLRAAQLRRLQGLFSTIQGRNQFYTRKFDAAGVNIDTIDTLDGLQDLPLTTKE